MQGGSPQIDYRPRPEQGPLLLLGTGVAAAGCTYAASLDSFSLKGTRLTSPASHLVAGAAAILLWVAFLALIRALRRDDPTLTVDPDGLHFHGQTLAWDEIRAVELKWRASYPLAARRLVVARGDGVEVEFDPSLLGRTPQRLCDEIRGLWVRMTA